MICTLWCLFKKNLAWYHHVMIGITVLVPLIWSVIITLWLPPGQKRLHRRSVGRTERLCTAVDTSTTPQA